MESFFGPPSELVDIEAFLKSTENLFQDQGFVSDSSEWLSLTQDQRDAIADDCSVADIQTELRDIWDNPTLAAHILKTHKHDISVLQTKPTKPGRKAYLPPPDTSPPEVANLRKCLDDVKLESWRLPANAGMFMRSPKNSDCNALGKLKSKAPPFGSPSSQHEAIIVLTAYSRVPWIPSNISRISQHALLASQNLEDLVNVIPCASNELLSETTLPDNTVTYNLERSGSQGIICVEGFAYDNGGDFYSSKFMPHLQEFSKDMPAIEHAKTTMRETQLSSLSLRINEPYWMLHFGNCEHFIVINQIRLLHPSDPSSGYPLTLQITPHLYDLCRACSKVPAIWSISGDIRLGESPCLLCGPCWRVMGDPDNQSVIILPLPNLKP